MYTVYKRYVTVKKKLPVVSTALRIKLLRNNVVLFFAGITARFDGIVMGEVARNGEHLPRPEPLRVAYLVTIGTVNKGPE